MKQTTSIHRLNGDRRLPLRYAGQLSYLAVNWLNNRLPHWRVDPRLVIRDFRVPDLDRLLPQVPGGSSPSRTLSDLFWLTLPWQRLQEELGAVHVLDVGCGGGDYGPRLLQWSGNRVAGYVGADVQAHAAWPALEAADHRLRFMRADAEDALGRAIPAGTNFIMSQSALEHIERDLRFFEHVRAYVRHREGPVVQVHLCPSAACLWLYLLHGVRQYTPRTLSTITRLFPDSDVTLYGLGGRACNRLHFQYITAPALTWRGGDLRPSRPHEYASGLRTAIATDMSRPQRSPAFYALVIHARPRSPVFV